MMENNITYTVENVRRETPDTVTLSLSCADGMPLFRSGQFINVFFPETGHLEGKTYSISSAPHEGVISITVKLHGIFSGKLHSLKQGDSFIGSLPYGYFFSEEAPETLVLIAGGIGIAPFRSLMLDVLKNSSQNIVLFYANKRKDLIIFREEFRAVQEEYGERVKVVYYLTQENDTDFLQGRIPVADIIHALPEGSKEFFICGSISFVRDYWKSLTQKGVPEETIYTEAFF